MRRAASVEAFVEDPLECWICTETCVIWCASRELVGAVCWGAPKVEQAQRIVDAFAGVWAPTLAERVDVVLDGRGITSIRADALDLLVTWSRSRVAELRSRVRKQVGVVDDGLTGFTLSGILPIVGRTHAFEVVNDPFVAFDLVGGEGGRAVCAEVLALAAQAKGDSATLHGQRALLSRECARVTLQSAAAALGVSPRSLQRDLLASGTAFAHELREARFQFASRLLTQSDDKLRAVASQVGLGETALRSLFRARLGCTPEQFRRQAR